MEFIKVHCMPLTCICSVCEEVHVGHPPHKIRTCNVMGSLANKEHMWKIGGMENILPVVESFHLYDRLGRAVSHNERLLVDRIPAIVELCIQGGVDIPEYPSRRRAFPAYSVAGKVMDFEHRFPKGEDAPGNGINTNGFWERRNKSSENVEPMHFLSDDLKGPLLFFFVLQSILQIGCENSYTYFRIFTQFITRA